MIEKPKSGRAIIRQDFNALNIEIPSKKNWILILFMIFWLASWVTMGRFAFRLSMSISIIRIWQLLIWFIGGLIALYAISWQLVGSEIIIFENNILTLKKSIKGIGLKKSYELKLIKNLNINPTKDSGIWFSNYNKDMFGAREGKIKFDYGMKTIKFAAYIDEAEARMIIAKLKESSYLKPENFA